MRLKSLDVSICGGGRYTRKDDRLKQRDPRPALQLSDVSRSAANTAPCSSPLADPSRLSQAIRNPASFDLSKLEARLAMLPKGSISSTPPLATASFGMPYTTQVSSFWAMV